MKMKLLKGLLIGVSLLSPFIPIKQPTYANSKYRFVCLERRDPQTKQFIPTTVAWKLREKVDVIRWTKPMGNVSPQERCEQVTPRFQKAYDNNSLRLVTNGIMNNQPVICTVKQYGGSCEHLIMTLTSADEGLTIINTIIDNLNGHIIGPRKHSNQIFVELKLD